MPAGKPPRDAVGNELETGQLILLKQGSEFLLCNVTEVTTGGLLATPTGKLGDAVQLRGHIRLLADFTIEYDSGVVIPQIYVLQQPRRPQGLLQKDDKTERTQ